MVGITFDNWTKMVDSFSDAYRLKAKELIIDNLTITKEKKGTNWIG